MASTDSNQLNLRSTRTGDGTAKPPTLAEFNGDLDQTKLVLKKLLESVEKIEKSDQERKELIKGFKSKGKDQDYPRLIELLEKLQLSTDFLSTNLSSYKEKLDQAIRDVTQIKRKSSESFTANSDGTKCLFWNPKSFSKEAQKKVKDLLTEGTIDLCIIIEAHVGKLTKEEEKSMSYKEKEKIRQKKKEDVKKSFKEYVVIFVEEKKIVLVGDKIKLGEQADLIGKDYYESNAIDSVLSYTHCLIIYRKEVKNETEMEYKTNFGNFIEYKTPISNDLYNDHFFSFEYRKLNFFALHRSSNSLKAHTLVLKNRIRMAKENCVVVGDVNWDYKVEKVSASQSHFPKMLRDQGFDQWVSEPTKGDKIIDVVFTRKNELDVFTDVRTFYSDKKQTKKIGDHRAVFFTVKPSVNHKDFHGDVKPETSSQL